MIPQVAHTAEFQRVLALPRRQWAANDLEYLAGQLTEILRTPAGTPCPAKYDEATQESRRAINAKLGLCPICEMPLALRPMQALSLYDAAMQSGLLCGLGVGDGKTLISLFLALVLRAKRPMLLLPASLIEKTQRDRLKLACHWKIPTTTRLFSYDLLGRVQAATELETFEPDLIIVDEVHGFKNRKAARTRRLARYMMAHPYTTFCGLSGTVMNKSIKDFAHILRWSLKLKAPIPITHEETEEWAEGLDNVELFETRTPGALLQFCNDVERANPPRVAARLGFQRRLLETAGVVATVGAGEHVDCSIYVRGIRHPVAQVTEQNFVILRGSDDEDDDTGWCTPDGWPLKSAVDVWRHAQELALGLHYVWDPRPPREWLDARTAWGAFARKTIASGRTYDSELHVANAVDAGKLKTDTLEAWRAVRDTFKPNVKAIWHDDSALTHCAQWMKTPGIVWTEHRFFAQRLAELTGAPYYGQKGFTDDGRFIEDHKPGSSCIASIDANREGKNLQGIWSRNLLVCPPKSSIWHEQVIGRTHRTGQTADEVIVDVLLGCRENFDAMMAAIESARVIEQTTGKKQKLLIADIALPSEAEIDALRSARWTR